MSNTKDPITFDKSQVSFDISPVSFDTSQVSFLKRGRVDPAFTWRTADYSFPSGDRTSEPTESSRDERLFVLLLRDLDPSAHTEFS